MLYNDMVNVMGRGEIQDLLKKDLPKTKPKTLGDVTLLKSQLQEAIMSEDYDKADEIQKLIKEAQS